MRVVYFWHSNANQYNFYLAMKENNGSGECGHCMNMCGHGQWTHILIKVFVALFIFWAGMQFGELKGIVRAEYGGGYGYGHGYRMMGAYGDGFYGPSMMGKCIISNSATSSVPKSR